MGSIFSSIIATFVTIPLLGYLLIFIICKQITKKHRRSVHIALDITTLLFVFSVHHLILTIWEHNYFWIIILFMLIIAIVFVLIFWKVKKEIDFSRVFRGYWRFNFLIFFMAYIVLTIIGLVQSVNTFVAMQ
ncbi:DUF3397 domain-containing protein [Cytobacillus solani]|uniref:DUF3397 domain-containing protein n=1 Tax=Cytobacillus solani TaxID=1637975 RepID=A0A0Q3T685_9BACI|nr:DUF3397 domain-containing protein [Cytobacillus solani]KOP82035.1 hypothetical protein AMS60_05780 [Bacillus sp. FJAT-21945]KQL18989.1 hypothetical protein AN957_10645 [Cytobacillus solani]USK56913.1 DUF3397 domain-containing protein [Cytobacillus solani]